MTAHALASRPAAAILQVETILLEDEAQLIPLLDTGRPLLWMRDGAGIAGIGEAIRLEFHGASRLREAAQAWRRLVACAQVSDEVHLPGTGLVGFGAFTFAPESTLASVLIVPSVIVGRRDGKAWLTRFTLTRHPVEPGGHREAGGRTETAGPGGTAHRWAPHRGAAHPGGILRWMRESRQAPHGHHLADFTGPHGGGRLPQPAPPGAEYRIAFTPGAMSAEAYRAAVAAAVARIRQGEVAKVVLARDMTSRLPLGADVRLALRKLATSYPQCWTYAVDGLVGSSPETLITVQDGSFSARVLAGTTSRGSDAAGDRAQSHGLQANPKDRREHELAVQSVVETLRAHSADLSRTPEPFTLKLPNLWHLATDVRGVLADGSTSLDLAAALHPTAAVAGTPAAAAAQVIRESEPFDRGRYAGPVGWVDAHGDGEWAIALRGAQIGPDRVITAYAGCGIVAGSDPESELAETGMKLRPIMETFG